MTQKICTECLNSFPETPEFFRQYKNNGKLFFRAKCHECERHKWREYEKNRTRDIDNIRLVRKPIVNKEIIVK